MSTKKRKTKKKKPFERLNIKQCLHVRLMRDTHAAIRVMCVQNNVSLQEIVEQMCNFLISGDPYVVKIFENLAEEKKNRRFEQLPEHETNVLFDAIQAYSPIYKEENREKNSR